ncbi:MAG: Stk1 family PASTA domain-containing Ser/Thr kinase [Butyrivibrio sp.]|nr:Stk1 family PASTA domain-containing Ser/Thr kinase [Butyrivibrio sp.]
MIKLGMVIGDRYEVLEKIGTGGMSDVYKAKDHKLNRYVAVKILKQEFSENDNFVSKFRVEAQAAAGLMHPNIVNVYDVGDENGIYYIVMELVEGITLKKYIEKKSRLTVKEAVSIAIQVAMGLEAAHNNNIIHRDIKPQNIIISKEGKVKVTDFGIAKAATSNTITSNVMGSVHYTSPEQARGGYSDAKSDIYSLGITLYEMLTGRVPFNGDTTVAIAIKHIQEDLQTPKIYNEDIPVSVEKIVLKCCQKSPDRRYQSAAELITDLKRSLITPDEDFVSLIDPDEEGATRVASEQEQEDIRLGSTGKMSNTEQMRLNKDVIKEAREEKYRSSRDYDDDYDNDDRDDRNERRRSRSDRYDRDYDDKYDDEDEDDGYDSKIDKITVAVAILAAILVGAIVIMLVGKYLGIFEFADSEASSNASSSGSSVTVTTDDTSGIIIPDVVGQTYAEAVSNLQAKGFTVAKATSDKNTSASGIVESMSPEGGTSAKSGTAITVYVSNGSNATSTTDTASSQTAASVEDNTATVPNVIGRDSEEACLMLIEAGLTPGEVIDTTNDDTSLLGLICAQSIASGVVVEKGTVINMEVSTGTSTVSYKYTGDISAPTEGENYTDGLSVHVTLVTADGTTLLDTTTASFPITGIERTGLTSSTGVLTFTYTATLPSTVDESGNTVGGGTQEYTVTRAVTFTQE